ncbi:MAG: RNA polymerase sigma factor [Salegentibacter sp.]|uniref:RNA polymerase sigma factor n=1 Tax=Salegentibacter sp. TaxID=1903072 RepID=UPI002870270C|nr:RNA polymerase sigma factor [Salegentibacter sp.]MDR9456447.1 RNA polymerase sigma factor [Salegentibacter sp.]
MKVIQLFKNEKLLIKRAANQNREAQRQLYDQHSGKMLSVCRQYIKDLQQAEEVMLSGFLKVFLHLKSFKNEGSFEGWIRRIMIRECISFLRSNKKLQFLEDEFSQAEISETVSSELSAEEIQTLIDELPEGYRMVFIMYAIEGYKHAEIADLLKITVGTSKSQLFKARKILQEKLIAQNTAYGTT